MSVSEKTDISYPKILINLRQYNGNDICADCKAQDPDWVSVKIGIYICQKCAEIHSELGDRISVVRRINSLAWHESELRLLENHGNAASNLFHEYNVPYCYRRPNSNSTRLLRTAWIRSKYECLDFVADSTPWFMQDTQEGVLMKKGRDDSRYLPRKFVLCRENYTLKYYNKEDSNVPKAVMRVADLNAVLAPEKMNQPFGMQLLFEQNDATRSIYVHAERALDIVNWYMAIRSVKLTYRRVAFPLMPESELSVDLTRDFVKEGWLKKTGPRTGDAFRKRWITIDARKLLYYEEPLDAVPKGEVYIGDRGVGFDVLQGQPAGVRSSGTTGHVFSLVTPDRTYHLSAATWPERDEWTLALNAVLKLPVTLRSMLASRHR